MSITIFSFHHLAQKSNAIQGITNKSSPALDLLTLCLFNEDPVLHGDKIFQILNIAGRDEKTTISYSYISKHQLKNCLILITDCHLKNVELRFRTLLAGKTRIAPMVYCGLKLFNFYFDEKRRDHRTDVLRVIISNLNVLSFSFKMNYNDIVEQVFDELEANGHCQVIVELLNQVLSPTKERNANLVPSDVFSGSIPLRLRLICIEVAIRTCLNNKFQEGAYFWLNEASHWNSTAESGNLLIAA